MKGSKLFKKIDRFIGIPIIFILGIPNKFLNFLSLNQSKLLLSGDRVLVVKLSALGDTFILLPIFKALKEKIGPDGKILMIATPINQAALKKFPYVDEVLVLNFGEFFKNPRVLLVFFKELKNFKPILALDFDQWLRISPLLCFLSGAKERYGFKTAGQYRHFLYQKTVLNEKNRHEFDQFISIAGLAGVEKSQVDHFNGFLKRENLYESTPTNLSSTKHLIHIHPGCGSYGWQRAWPEKYYVQLIQRLSLVPQTQIRMTGMGTYEENLISEILKEAQVPVDNRSGKLEIEQLSGLLREADLVVCGNTGIMHLAIGLGKSVVTMNGPANPTKWGPLGPAIEPIGKTKENSGEISLLLANIHCSPCTMLGFEYGCKFRPCMESISVEMVYEECIRLLEKTVKTQKGSKEREQLSGLKSPPHPQKLFEANPN